MSAGETKDEDLREAEALKAEKAYLLDELEMAYRNMEGILSTADYETQITYQELRKRNQELQRRLVELESAHSRLQEAQRMLVRSERMSAMGQMAAAIVHEINNPLAVIAGQVEMLFSAGGRTKEKESLGAILHASVRLKDLTQNILNFSRRKQTEPCLVDLTSLADEVLAFFLPITRHIDVQTDLAIGLPEIMGDAAQVEQVLTNFVVNALDATRNRPGAQLLIATGEGTIAAIAAAEQAAGRAVRLAIKAESQSQQRPCVFAAVEDNGPGMAPETMEEIFEAFFTTKGEEKGTGLGLAICRSIAESFQGNILVASRVDAGASFRLFLPILSTSRGA
ncbi:MAG: ATP-binding protein [Candidatus Latescibacterota bacterium]